MRLSNLLADYCLGWFRLPEGYARVYALKFSLRHCEETRRPEGLDLLCDPAYQSARLSLPGEGLYGFGLSRIDHELLDDFRILTELASSLGFEQHQWICSFWSVYLTTIASFPNAGWRLRTIFVHHFLPREVCRAIVVNPVVQEAVYDLIGNILSGLGSEASVAHVRLGS